MVNMIRTIYPCGFGSKFCVGFRVRHETPEGSQMRHQLKRCEYNIEDYDISPNTVSDKIHQASSQKIGQIMDVSRNKKNGYKG